MARSIFAGGTSWKNQPFSSFIKDLNIMFRSTLRAKKLLEKQYNQISKKPWLKSIDNSLIEYYNHSVDLCDMILELKKEFKNIKKKRIRNGLSNDFRKVATRANKLNGSIGCYWNNHVLTWSGILKQPYFYVLKQLYCNIRDSYADMLDWAGIADKIAEYENLNDTRYRNTNNKKMVKNPWVLGILTGVIAGLIVWFIITFWRKIYDIINIFLICINYKR